MRAGAGSDTGTAQVSGEGVRVAVVASRFNDFAVSGLVRGALDALRQHGVDDTATTLLRVPGAWEIPVVARRLAQSGRYAAVIALGALIRGETAHFERISEQVARGLATASEDTGVPITFGVITAETKQQALDRAGGKHGNLGAEAALAVFRGGSA